jgi:hypothetical protein
MFTTAPDSAPDHSHDLLRPFMWVAILAFLTGFLGYLALFMPGVQA